MKYRVGKHDLVVVFNQFDVIAAVLTIVAIACITYPETGSWVTWLGVASGAAAVVSFLIADYKDKQG